MAVIEAGGIALPDPVSISIDDEIIWSEDTGRTLNGLMVGDVVTEKKKVNIEWGILKQSEVDKIKEYLVSGFFAVRFPELNITLSAYRGTISAEHIGKLGDGFYWYRKVSVGIVER